MERDILSHRQHVTSNVLQVPPEVDVSRIVDARGFNAARFDLVVLNSNESLIAAVQGSDDLENWTTLASLGSSFAIGFALPAAVTGITVSYLRLRFSIGGEGGFAIVAAGVNLTNL
ncbi:MAG: hypothetical protein R3F56_10470 [Planctomycetota bacterium]